MINCNSQALPQIDCTSPQTEERLLGASACSSVRSVTGQELFSTSQQATLVLILGVPRSLYQS